MIDFPLIFQSDTADRASIFLLDPDLADVKRRVTTASVSLFCIVCVPVRPHDIPIFFDPLFHSGPHFRGTFCVARSGMCSVPFAVFVTPSLLLNGPSFAVRERASAVLGSNGFNVVFSVPFLPGLNGFLIGILKTLDADQDAALASGHNAAFSPRLLVEFVYRLLLFADSASSTSSLIASDRFGTPGCFARHWSTFWTKDGDATICTRSVINSDGDVIGFFIHGVVAHLTRRHQGEYLTHITYVGQT